MAKLAINGGPQAAEGFDMPEWPLFDDEYKEIVLNVLSSRHWGRLYSDSRVEEFERAFAEFQGAQFGVGVTNGTTALELALLACGIEPGDEVLVPAVSFIASASARPIISGVRVGAAGSVTTSAVASAGTSTSLDSRPSASTACFLAASLASISAGSEPMLSRKSFFS